MEARGGAASGVDDIGIVRRCPTATWCATSLVQAIVKAYEKYEKKNER